MRWTSARSRNDGRPTDTQADTKSRSPRQDAADHCLTCQEDTELKSCLLRFHYVVYYESIRLKYIRRYVPTHSWYQHIHSSLHTSTFATLCDNVPARKKWLYLRFLPHNLGDRNASPDFTYFFRDFKNPIYFLQVNPDVK